MYPVLLVELTSSTKRGFVMFRKVFKAAFFDAGCKERMFVCMIRMHACRSLCIVSLSGRLALDRTVGFLGILGTLWHGGFRSSFTVSNPLETGLNWSTMCLFSWDR